MEICVITNSVSQEQIQTINKGIFPRFFHIISPNLWTVPLKSCMGNRPNLFALLLSENCIYKVFKYY